MPIYVIIIISCLLSIAIFVWISRKWKRYRLYRRFRKGVSAEALGEKILKSYGYEVTGIQKSITMTIYVDDKPRNYEVRPDGIAKKGKELYLVEIKTGNRAVDPLYSYTRRQLLEYYYSSCIDGVLLVNADLRKVQVIRFPRNPTQKHGKFLPYFITFALGAFCGASYFLFH